MKKIILFYLIFLSFTTTVWGTVCYSLSNASNVLTITLEPNSNYNVPFNNWSSGLVTLSWDASLGPAVIQSSNGLNGWPYAVDGPAQQSGGSGPYYQKFSFGPTHTASLTSGVSIDVIQITVSHPSISVGDFSIVEIPPIAGGTANLENFLGEQWLSGACNLVTINVSLPVELISFRASPADKQIQLNWVTASEINFSHYDLERSMDGRDFALLTEVVGKGNTYNDYGYADREVKPGNTYYYRLRMNDMDGEYEYSHIVQARLDGNQIQVDISPNPAADYINVRYNTEEESNVLIRLFDTNGRLLYFSDSVSSKGVNRTTMDLSKLAAGIYILTFKDGDYQYNQKIVKQ